MPKGFLLLVVLAILAISFVPVDAVSRNLKKKKGKKKKKKGGKASVASEDTCSMNPMATQGSCTEGLSNSMRIIVNSCGDVRGPITVGRALEEGGQDISNYENATVFSEGWDYMRSLDPDKLVLAGDNVYNDGIANWGKNYHPFGKNLATVLADASEDFMKYHGYLTEDGDAGPLFYGYLEILKDKIADGYTQNAAFQALREHVNDGVTVTWDDHDFLTNDPSNPHFLRGEFRKAEIEAVTGWDRKHFRFGAAHKGIERSWTEEIADNHGKSFLIRFIVIDEETTHFGTQGCAYYANPDSPTGFTPRQAANKTKRCPDMDVVEDFHQDNPKRVFFGDDQLAWFKEEIMKPADLIFVINGGPNFETDYDYNSLIEFPAEKRKFIQVLRESGVEHLIFLTGDSHASYVTKVPHIVGYPLYTIVGSGLTKGLSYDRYVSYWGDISHRFLVAAGSTNHDNKAATFAEVEVFFDDENEAVVRFTPHMRESVPTNDGWTTWVRQVEPFENEPWAAQYDIKVSDLEIPPEWPRYHYDEGIEHKFVTEVIYVKYTPEEDGVEVSLTVTNSKKETKTFELKEGANCGAGNYGFCKDKWGAFVYVAPKPGEYTHSLVNQELCEHAGYVGDHIEWTISENGIHKMSGETELKFRNTVLHNSAGELEDLYHFGTQPAYYDVVGDSIGFDVIKIINEPPVYGGYKVPVKGFDGNKFDVDEVQALYEAYLAADDEAKDVTALQAAYLATYYPNMPRL